MPLFNTTAPSGTSLITSSTITETAVTILGTSSGTQLLAANPARKGAVVMNNSSNIIYLGTSSSITNTSGYFQIVPAGGSYELPYNYTGALFAAASAASTGVNVAEFT